ncbi:MAG: asparagine synthase (glutamine-hydrolyzing) [Blastocatellia bacterium]
MCGIAGYIGNVDEATRRLAVQAMTDAIERRGPDGAGLESWPDATLGHRRLAIIDLSEAGHQPMLTEDRRLGVVFNGEIYNFHELRRELIERGCRFRSLTDTEALLHGYREWGLDAMVARLRGMFAFALWDDERRKLFLVRDRLGVKPLVYIADGQSLAFASTARALKDAGLTGDLNPQAIAEYLEFGFITDDRAVYRNVIKVPAAGIVEWADGRVTTRCYWQPPEVNPSLRISFDEAVEETERIFVESVRLRLHADVPVGALLSGGVDSSLVCWATAKLGADVAAYTVGTPGDVWDESEDARATAQQLGVRHHVLEMSAGDAPDVDELVSAFGEPFACASALGMLGVSRVVSSSAKVLLTGDGGDDVFLGYPEHRHFWMAQRLAGALPGFSTNVWQRCRDGLPQRGVMRRARSFMDYVTGGLGAVTQARDGWPVYQRNGLLGERLRDVRIPQREIAWSQASARRVLTDFLRYDLGTRFTGEYLPKVDGATMHHSIEARSPFLDYRLWEFAASLPFELRLKGGTLKAILRELARRRLGERVATGRKRGFGIPVQRWIAGKWRERVAASLRDGLLEREGWIRGDAAVAQLERAARVGWSPNQLWYLFVLESWLRRERNQTAPATTPHDERVLSAMTCS